jgi:hypothetical protein
LYSCCLYVDIAVFLFQSHSIAVYVFLAIERAWKHVELDPANSAAVGITVDAANRAAAVGIAVDAANSAAVTIADDAANSAAVTIADDAVNSAAVGI